jgi:hypothetical protein
MMANTPAGVSRPVVIVTLAAMAALAALTADAAARQSRPAPTTEATAPREAGEPIMAIVSIMSQQVTFYDADGWILRAPVSTGSQGGLFDPLRRWTSKRARPLLQLSLAEGPNQETGRSVTIGITRVVFFWYSKNPLKLVVSLVHSRSRSSAGAISARAIFLSAPIWYVTRGFTLRFSSHAGFLGSPALEAVTTGFPLSSRK